MKQLTLVEHLSDVQTVSTRTLSIPRVIQWDSTELKSNKALKPIAFNRAPQSASPPVPYLIAGKKMSQQYS